MICTVITNNKLPVSMQTMKFFILKIWISFPHKYKEVRNREKKNTEKSG